jgi:hypothetical protein
MIRLFSESDQEQAEALSRRGFFGATAALVASVALPAPVIYSFATPRIESILYMDTGSVFLANTPEGEALGRELAFKWKSELQRWAVAFNTNSFYGKMSDVRSAYPWRLS